MKLEVLQENLREGLGSVLRAVTNRPQLPVLANVMLTARKDGLVVSATDLEMGVVVKLGAKVQEEGAMTVPARMLYDFVSSLSPGKVSLDKDKDTLNVESGNYEAKFQIIEATEFPELPSRADKGKAVVIQMAELSRAVGKVGFAAAKDMMRPVLTGVLFEFGESKFQLAATDGFRLATTEIGYDGQLKGTRVLIPARVISEIVKSGDEGEVAMEIIESSGQVVFEVGDTVIVAQVLSGDFPDYRRIIPDDYGTEVIFDREELLRAVKVAMVFAKESSNVVRWSVGEGEMVMTADSPEYGTNTSRVVAQVTGDGGEIAFNGKFLLDFLSSIESERVWFGMNERLLPGALREDGNKALIYVVMPINV